MRCNGGVEFLFYSSATDGQVVEACNWLSILSLLLGVSNTWTLTIVWTQLWLLLFLAPFSFAYRTWTVSLASRSSIVRQRLAGRMRSNLCWKFSLSFSLSSPFYSRFFLSVYNHMFPHSLYFFTLLFFVYLFQNLHSWASSCLSARSSALNNSATTGRIFVKFCIWEFFDKPSRKLKSLI